MMGWTDRHYRFMMRLITKQTLLYTEMIHAKAILKGNQDKLLSTSEVEHPVALQIGGNNKKELKECVQIAHRYGYDEINLNVGCPSPKVQKGLFGVSLMRKPELVGELVSEMKSVSPQTPITVKSRIGIEGEFSYQKLFHFISLLQKAACDKLILHSRVAFLGNISPKKNRLIPKINYEITYQMKKEFPQFHIEINGEVNKKKSIQSHLQKVDSVMIGREAYQNPLFFRDIDSEFFQQPQKKVSTEEIIEQMKEYIASQKNRNLYFKPCFVKKHLLNLFKSVPNRKKIQKQVLDF